MWLDSSFVCLGFWGFGGGGGGGCLVFGFVLLLLFWGGGGGVSGYHSNCLTVRCVTLQGGE